MPSSPSPRAVIFSHLPPAVLLKTGLPPAIEANDKPGCSLTLPPHPGSMPAARLSQCLENTQCCQVDELLLCQGTNSRATPGEGAGPSLCLGAGEALGTLGHIYSAETRSITGLTLCGALARAATSFPEADLRAGAGLQRTGAASWRWVSALQHCWV